MTTVSSIMVKPRAAGLVASTIIRLPDQQTKTAHTVAGMGHLRKVVSLLACYCAQM
jgi:hypothetical protein